MNVDSDGHAVDTKTQLIGQLQKSEKEYQSLLAYLRSQKINENGSQRAFLPLGPLAYASGTLKPRKGVIETVLVLLGENYFARVSLEHALSIAERRIAFIHKRLSDLKPSELEQREGKQQREASLLEERWNKGMHLLEQYLQATDVVNLCEEYDDAQSEEPIRVHGLKEGMLERSTGPKVDEIVDWNSLLDVSGTLPEPTRRNEKLPDSIWKELQQLEITETCGLMGETVEDSNGNFSKFEELPAISQESNLLKNASSLEQEHSKAFEATSEVAPKLVEKAPATFTGPKTSRKTFSGIIKERKSPSN